MKARLEVCQRIFPGRGLEDDSSVELLISHTKVDLHVAASIGKGIMNMPIPSQWKSQLMNSVDGENYVKIFRLDRPLVYIYRFYNGETRWFLITAKGNLVESDKQRTWDSAFPFLVFNQNMSRTCTAYEADHETVATSLDLLWLPESQNYTHFLYDFYAPALWADMLLGRGNIDTGHISYLSCKPPAWQEVLLRRLTFEYTEYSLPRYAQTAVVRPSTVVLPIVSNTRMALKALRMETRKGLLQKPVMRGATNVLLLTRSDARRARIRNIEEIEGYVDSIGGAVVDISQLTLEEKRRVISNHNIIIAESSGCINFALFCTPSHHLISLVEEGLLRKEEFIYGGWDYTASYADNNVTYIIGERSETLEGSPVGSASYRLQYIIEAISRIRDC
jgi:hypothetical protein